MNKIKFLTPILGLGAISSAVIPLTACAEKAASFSLDKETAGTDWTPYPDKIAEETEIPVKNVISTYTKHFKKDLNKTLAKDVTYGAYKIVVRYTSWLIVVRDCKFNTHSNRLSWNVNATLAGAEPLSIEVYNVKYIVCPSSSEDTTPLFSLAGASDGSILMDQDWHIKMIEGDLELEYNSSTTLAEWKEFWVPPRKQFFEFTPFYLEDTKLI